MSQSPKQNIANARLEDLLGQRGPEKRALTVKDIDGIVAEKIQEVLQHRFLLAGDVFFRMSSNRDAGAIRADGSAVSRLKYPALFAAYGTAHGAGDGTTTFNLPNIPDLSGMKAFIKT